MAFFIIKIKTSPHGLWYNRTATNYNQSIRRRYSYDNTKTAHFGRCFFDCQKIFDSDKPQFLTILENHIDLDSIIPVSFYNHYYSYVGRNHKYPLTTMLWALIIQRIFSIPKDSLLLVFLNYSRHLSEFCRFTKIFGASKITHFKQDFLQDFQLMFDKMVDVT